MMQTIASFEVNHDLLREGLYISRVDGDITTYDLRMVRPNNGHYLSNAAIHSFEHLFAVYARNSVFAEHVVYVGPMGCRTGFYLLVRDLAPEDSIQLVQDAIDYIAFYEGKVPGRTPLQCGNYIEHNLADAKEAARQMQGILSGWSEEQLRYPE